MPGRQPTASYVPAPMPPSAYPMAAPRMALPPTAGPPPQAAPIPPRQNIPTDLQSLADTIAQATSLIQVSLILKWQDTSINATPLSADAQLFSLIFVP